MRYYDNLITNNATRFEDRQVSNVRYNGEKVTVNVDFKPSETSAFLAGSIIGVGIAFWILKNINQSPV